MRLILSGSIIFPHPIDSHFLPLCPRLAEAEEQATTFEALGRGFDSSWAHHEINRL